MISVICPIYNEEKYIAKCIESILEQDYPKDDLEVIFVDGMSTDRTRGIVAEYTKTFPFIRMVDNPDRIVPPAMNIGIRLAKGEIIIRLDAHAIFPSDYFSELTKNLIELGADNVGGVCRTLPIDDTVKSRSIAAVLSSSFGMGNSYFRIGADSVREVDTVPFGCFRRELFDRIGYFDEELIRNQDDEFNGRIIKNGGKIYLIPSVVIDYYARDTVAKVYKMFYQYGLFKPLVNKKLGSPATIRQFVPLCFTLGLILGPLTFLISPVFVWIYSAVIICYIGMAAFFSAKTAAGFRQWLMQIWVYFVVHFAYGWGYINGMVNLLLKRNKTVNSNR